MALGEQVMFGASITYIVCVIIGIPALIALTIHRHQKRCDLHTTLAVKQWAFTHRRYEAGPCLSPRTARTQSQSCAYLAVLMDVRLEVLMCDAKQVALCLVCHTTDPSAAMWCHWQQANGMPPLL